MNGGKRKPTRSRRARLPAAALALGEANITGKTILLTEEQGLRRARFNSAATRRLSRKRGARIILEVPPQLTRLTAGLTGVAQTVETGRPLPAFDFHCPLMSLPLALKTELATIPAAILHI